jgi:glycosyltransferase involved in cell wall biosynthesis
MREATSARWNAGCARSATSTDVRTLHVAALPFPSPQGTQALLHAMLSALHASGHDTHLLCYPHGASFDSAPPYQVHRSTLHSASGSLRSGPSPDKAWLDLGIAQKLRTTYARLAPDVLIAHHVEAAACAAALRLPYVFVAHTSLRDELPTYASPGAARCLRAFGGLLDNVLVRRARATLAVSPLLATLLARASNRAVQVLPLPWQVPPPSDALERARARESFALTAEQPVLLYAGNLDAYQGLDALLPALRSVFDVKGDACLLIASAHPPDDLELLLREHRLLERTRFVPLANECDRRRAHAAASLALVPRRAAGGIPIKLLDAFARGVPVVAARLALAGHPYDALCEVVEPERPWDEAILQLLASPRIACDRAVRARARVESGHDAARFVAALEGVAATFSRRVC